MKEEFQIIDEISTIVHKIVVVMWKESKIPNDQIVILLNELDDFRKISTGKEVISKKLAYELFYLYNNVISQLSYEEDKEISIITELYMKISSVLNDGLYQ
ncbi:MAG: hypothetical protein K6T94_08300 [Paenibacillus sp.]|nr:hypothetical protein [Paenibacillus sp.]